jgi:ribonuclease P protein component
MIKYTLKKNEILSSRKQINELFSVGKVLFKFPFKMVYIFKSIESEKDSKALFSISVPKRKIKTAVERNLIKRRTREAYRLNKHLLYDKIPKGKQLVFMFIYVDDAAKSFEQIQNSILTLINKFHQF